MKLVIGWLVIGLVSLFMSDALKDSWWTFAWRALGLLSMYMTGRQLREMFREN